MIIKLYYRLRFNLLYNKERRIISKVIRSIGERFWDESIKKYVDSILLRTAPVIEEYKVEPNSPWIRNSKCFDAEFTYEMNDVIVSTFTGVTWLPDGRIMGESYGSLNRLIKSKKFQLDYFGPTIALNQIAIPLATTDGFFHFMFESLPAAMASFEKYPKAKFLVANNSPVYVLDFARLLLDEDPIKIDGAVRVSKLIVSGKTPYSGFVQRAELNRIKTFFEKRCTNEKSELKIYISRIKDKRRCLENETELEKQLISIGFQSFLLQEMAVIDQIKLFQRAKLVIAPHGAGLSNLIWCNAGVRVIEIFPFKPRNDCYARLSINLDLAYEYVVCNASKNSAGLIPIDKVVKLAKCSNQ
jgi:hypothetical protein